MPTIREVKTELRHREWAKHLRKNSLTASCRGVKHCLKPATEHIIRLLKTRLRLVTASHPQYFIVTDSISPHSNSQQLTVIHCDEPNTGFESRLISAHFFARWSGWRLPCSLISSSTLTEEGDINMVNPVQPEKASPPGNQIRQGTLQQLLLQAC